MATPVMDAPAAADTAAPYGRLKNGKPRKTPPKKHARQTPTTRRAAPRQPDYRPGIRGLAQVICLPLSFAAPADAWAVDTYVRGTPEQLGIADALNDLAKERPEVAAALERVLQAGPYGALIGSVVPLVVQLAVNHGIVPEAIGERLGAAPKRVILEHLRMQVSQESEVPREHPSHPLDERPDVREYQPAGPDQPNPMGAPFAAAGM